MLIANDGCELDSRTMKTLFSNSSPPDDLAWVTADKYNRPRYSTFEVARYVGVPESTLRFWVVGRPYPKRTGGRGFSGPLINGPDNSDHLSFVNLVEAHILQCIKFDHDIGPKEVRKTLDYLSQELNSDHPLIEYEFTTHGSALLVRELEKLLSASSWGQYNFPEILEDKLEDVEWRDGKLFRLFPRSKDTKRLIVMNPSLSSGRPVVSGSGVLASVIWRRHQGGESIETLARDYRLEPKAIKAAVEFTKAA